MIYLEPSIRRGKEVCVILAGFPTEKKIIRSFSRNKMFTVARAHAIKKSKIFSLRHNKVYN